MRTAHALASHRRINIWHDAARFSGVRVVKGGSQNGRGFYFVTFWRPGSSTKIRQSSCRRPGVECDEQNNYQLYTSKYICLFCMCEYYFGFEPPAALTFVFRRFFAPPSRCTSGDESPCVLCLQWEAKEQKRG